MQRPLALVLALAGAVACTTPNKAPAISADEARIPAAPAPTATEPKPAAIAEPPPDPKPTPVPGPEPKVLEAPPQQQQADAPKPALGAPCAAGTTGCGRLGKIAVVTAHNRMRVRDATPPCKPLHTTPPFGAPGGAHGGYSASACVDGERVYVSSVCVVCRMDTESNTLGVVAEMTPEQLDAAQRMAQLPAKPALTTPAAWKGAIDAAAARAKAPKQ
jgi:hypothetical protein